ncbi:hypothetical protein Ptr86124_002064 [Pyrenophora tritici-repentis]|uniref:Uncharacterized protein n=1 Tax=Pyrenophora tritici-repentis TaxID=45151 RepID=A0A922SUG0_9PLEO|nr:hypothetical protein Ptr86124_002064 [Pyrenophora tritici-repentis]
MATAGVGTLHARLSLLAAIDVDALYQAKHRAAPSS